jgi:hypothetical protein
MRNRVPNSRAVRHELGDRSSLHPANATQWPAVGGPVKTRRYGRALPELRCCRSRGGSISARRAGCGQPDRWPVRKSCAGLIGEVIVTFRPGDGGADIQPGQLLRVTGKARQSGNRPMPMIDPAYYVIEEPQETP